MAWKIKCWIPIDIEPEDDTILPSREEAEEELQHLESFMDGNMYHMVECDDDGEEM